MKFGFEREFFVQNGNGEYVLANALPHDDCGYLAEIRGEPDSDPIRALGLYKIEEYKVRKQAEKLGLNLIVQDFAKLPKAFVTQALRRFGKNPATEDGGSMYGKFWQEGYQRAGLHVHFSNQIVHTWEERVPAGDNTFRLVQRTTTYPGFIDMPRFIFGLDKIFAEEIKQAKRVPGLYEIKPHGFEYRSLPTSVDMEKVARAVATLQRYRWSSSLELI